MSAHDADFIRRIELERADARKQTLDEAIQNLKNYPVKSAGYQKMLKTAVRVLMEQRAKC